MLKISSEQLTSAAIEYTYDGMIDKSSIYAATSEGIAFIAGAEWAIKELNLRAKKKQKTDLRIKQT